MSGSVQTAIETPVPGDEPSPVVQQLPWNSIPKFTPGVTNVQEYVQKLKFLAAMWPTDHLSQLAPRAALLVEGTAFKKVARLDPAKLRVNDQTGIALLVDAMGGSWGATELEERYEFFEKALYGTVQRSDESHDSFLSRMEASFVELLNRGTKLEEVQAYVLLRQSLLSAEDKKRILLEHSGELKYNPVVKSYRLLGSKFFSEVQGNRQGAKTKVYDVNVSETVDYDSRSFDDVSAERAFVTLTEEPDLDLDVEFMDIMIAAEDSDALTVSSFEQELEEFLQDVPDMHDAMVSYLEARSKLLEKRRSRGFWPVKFGEKGGKAGGKFKGRGKGKRQREQLLSRIARSTCRICHQKGHWKAECPNRDKAPDMNSTAAANVAEEMPVADVHEVLSEPESLPSGAEDVQGFMSQSNVLYSMPMHHKKDETIHDAYVVQALHDPVVKNKLRDRIRKVFAGVHSQPEHPTLPRYVFPVNGSRTDRQSPALSVPRAWKQPEPLPDVCNLAASCNKPCHAILDTGASRCVIGERVWLKLFEQLPESLQKKIRRKPSQVKFRFGNNQTLQSEYQVQMPMQSSQETGRKLLLTIEVLPGSTPFLFSKRAFKQLGGILDTTNDTCYLQRLDRRIPLELNATELYLIDVRQLCASPSSINFFKSFSKPDNSWSDQSRGVNCSQGPVLSPEVPKNETHVENIALTLAKPASKPAVLSVPDPPLPVDKYANCSHDGLTAHCGGSRSESPDHVASVHDSAVGDAPRESRESAGNDEYTLKHGSRIAESTNDVTEPHVPRKPSADCPRFNWRFNANRRLTRASCSEGTTSCPHAKDSRCELPVNVLSESVSSTATSEREHSTGDSNCGLQPCDKLASLGGKRGGGDCGYRWTSPGSESGSPSFAIELGR